MSENNLKVLHVYKSLNRSMGGPATSVPSLCRELSRCACNVKILTIDYDERDIEDYGDSELIRYSKMRDHYSIIKEADIVHLHGVWPVFHNRIMKLCRKMNVKYIISLRASLMLSDINKTYAKIIKKHVAWKLFFKKNLVNASGFHVTARNELDDLKKIGFDSVAAMSPNGINIDELSKLTDRNIISEMFPKTKNKRILLYFSRIAPKKGLALLAHAWEKVSRDNPSWYLLIIGPDNESHWPEIEKIFVSHRQDNYTRYAYLSGNARIAVLQHADLFILPTYWENFGIVVAEALMAGTPVITTTKTPWSELKSMGCGWTVEPSQEAIINILSQAMEHDNQRLQEMGNQGRIYVSERFDWRNIAIDMKRYYEYILGLGLKPEFVHRLQSTGKPFLPIRKPGFVYELM